MKRSMQVLAAAILSASAVWSVAVAAEPLKIGVSGEPYQPFTWKEATGEWKGFEIDLAKAMCAEMKVECVTTEIAWDGIIPALQAKQIDMIMNSMSITEKRKQTINFSDPYYTAVAAFIGPKDASTDLSPDAMKGKIIGVQVATTHAEYAQKTYGNVAQVKQYNTQDEVNQDLAAGRIDMLLADRVAMMSFLDSDQGKDFKVLADAPMDESFGTTVGIGLRKEDEELRTKVNAAIAALLKNGKYDEVAKPYFDFDIYGMKRAS